MLVQLLVPTAIAALIWARTASSTVTHDVTQDFVGRGRIHLLNTSSFVDATRKDRIGCLNAHGMLTLDDCAVFTRYDDSPHSLYTRAGNCSFRNPNMPTNRDSKYGQGSHAWSCGGETELRPEGPYEYYYTVQGFKYPFVCNGNINCFYDIVATPPGDDCGPLPLWQYAWGSEQMDIPKGHWKVLLLWDPVSKGRYDDESGRE